MNNWQGLAIGLCTVALIGAALQPFIPKNGMGKLLRFMITACFLGVLLYPLISLTDFSLPDFSATDGDLNETLIQEQLRGQVETQVNDVLTEKANEVLKSYRLSVKKAVAKVDIDDDGGISISQVQIYLDARNLENQTTVLQVLRKHFGESVVIVDG